MANPFDAVQSMVDNPDNPFEQAKDYVGGKVESFFGSDTGQNFAEDITPALTTLSKLAIPYRDYVAPGLTSVLLQLNSNYREQNQELSFVEQMNEGFMLAKESVEGEEEWRRSVSPGRALVGLIGDWNFTGEQGTDKIDWADSKQVNDYFTSGSAQFWSGFADLGFNILDPVGLFGGKAFKTIKRSQFTREAGSKFGRTDALVSEIDEAVTNEASDTAAAQIFKLVEKDPENIAAIQAMPLAAGSSNPSRYAIMLSDAQKLGGRQAMGDVIKASIGHKPSLEKVKTQYEEVYELLLDNTGKTQQIMDEEAAIGKLLDSKIKMSPDNRLKNIEAKDKVALAKEKMLEEQEQLLLKREAFKPVVEQDFGVTSTWSKYSYIERVRTGIAERQSDGIFLDVDPMKKFSLAREVAKANNMKTFGVRAAMWVSPNQQLREVPSGLAHLGGAAGERSFLEADSRISQIGKLAGKDKVWMQEKSNMYRRLTSKSERFYFLDNLQDEGIESLLQKHYGSELGLLNATQREAAEVFARELIQSTNRAKSREIKSLLENKYTVVDEANGGSPQAHLVMDKAIKTLAEQRAVEAGRPVRTEDFDAVKRALMNNQLTETQVPGIHFSVDLKFFDRIMAENPQLLRNVINGILEDGLDAQEVRRIMQTAERAALEGRNGALSLYSDILKPGVRTSYDVAIDSLDKFYTYAWKPFTLLSFKYTTRNVAEGYLRTVASMIDYSSYYGYGWVDMWQGRRDPGTIARGLGNREYRRSGKKASDEFNAKSEILRKEQGIIRKQIVPTTSGTKLAFNVKRIMIDEANKELIKDADGLALSTIIVKDQISALRTYKSSGIKEADDVVKSMRELIKPLLSGEGDYGSDAGNEFIRLFTSGKYSEAASVATRSDSLEIVNALTKFRDDADKAFSVLSTKNANGAQTVEFALENAKFALGRINVHADKTIDLLVSRADMQGELSTLGGKIAPTGKIRKSYSGEEQVEIIPGVFIGRAFSGEGGEMVRNASSSKVSSTRVLADERNVTGHGALNAGHAVRPVDGADVRWANGHSDYVNNVLMKDAAARKIIEGLAEGKSPQKALDDAGKWLDSSDPEAVAWKREVKENMTGMSRSMDTSFTFQNQLDVTYAQIEQYLPTTSSVPGVAYGNIHKIAIDGMTPEESAKIHIRDRFEVVTGVELQDKRFTNLYKNAVSGVFNVIGTMPEDRLVRHPFFSMVHDAEAKKLARKYEAEARKVPGATDESVRAYVEANADRIKTGATNRAYKELMQRLYSVERFTSPGKLLRFLTPFYMAHQNSSRFWLGTTARNPEIAYMLAKAYNAPFRSGYVYDEEGNVVEEGTPWGKETGKQNIVLNSAWLRGVVGRDTITINPTGFDVITQGQLPVIPTFGGPVGEVIATEGIKAAAKNTEVDSFLQDNFGITFDEFSSKHILPFYEKGYGRSLLSNVQSAAIPFNSATISALAATYGMTGSLPLVEQVVPQVQQRWVARLDAARDQVVTEMIMDDEALDPDVIKARAESIARRALMAEAASSFVGPVVAGKTQDSQMMDLNRRLTKYQNELGYSEGSVKLVSELDEQGVMFASGLVSTLRSSTSDNRFGLISNTQTVKGVQKNADSLSKAAQLYEDNPFIGELFNIPGDDVNYSPIADDLLYSIEINGEPLKSRNMSPEDAERRAQMSAGWATYFDNLEYIEKDAEKNGIKKGSAAYRAYYSPWKERLADYVGGQYPIWDTRENRITLQKSDKFIELALYFTKDEKFMSTVGSQNKAVKGLQMYLEGRETIIAELEKNRALTGTEGLDTKANQRFADWRDRMAEYIITQNPEFEQMYTRYLSQDELNIVDSPLLNGVK
jgi:hypothetical protein